MRREYSRPPIVEVLCDFHFVAGQPWDLTVPGLVYDRVKDDFPLRQQRGIVSFQVKAETGEAMPEISAIAPATCMQFVRLNGEAMIQVGPNNLTVNHLRPYPGWPVYREIVKRALAVYQAVAVPESIERIGLRYVNRVELPEQLPTINRYLSAIPGIPVGIPKLIQSWVQRVEVQFEEQNAVLALQSGSLAELNQESQAFLLDLDFYTVPLSRRTVDEAMAWVDQAHEQVESVFEACITDEARELFGEVK